MLAKDYESKHVEKIFELYYRHVGPADFSFLPPFLVVKDIHNGEVLDGYRVGSRWTGDSKLVFKEDFRTAHVTPYFNPNFHPRDRDSDLHLKAQEAGKLFKKESLEYLASVNK